MLFVSLCLLEIFWVLIMLVCFFVLLFKKGLQMIIKTICETKKCIDWLAFDLIFCIH